MCQSLFLLLFTLYPLLNFDQYNHFNYLQFTDQSQKETFAYISFILLQGPKLKIQNLDLVPNGSNISLHPLCHPCLSWTASKNEDYPHKPTQVLLVCFILTYMLLRKIHIKSPNIELLEFLWLSHWKEKYTISISSFNSFKAFPNYTFISSRSRSYGCDLN